MGTSRLVDDTDDMPEKEVQETNEIAAEASEVESLKVCYQNS